MEWKSFTTGSLGSGEGQSVFICRKFSIIVLRVCYHLIDYISSFFLQDG
jgi:hypothetical protein